MQHTFHFNEKYKEFEGELFHLKVIIPAQFMNDETAFKAHQICEAYQQNLEQLASFFLGDEDFTMIYGELSTDELLTKLGPPVVTIYQHGGKLTYLHHQLDEDHIIDVEFEGIMEHFIEISVDG